MSEKSVVLDNGSGVLKCGFAGDSFPAGAFSTAVGRPVIRAGARNAAGGKSELKATMVGDETSGKWHQLEMTYPVKNGIVNNYDDMCLLWNYAFQQKLKLTEPGDFASRGVFVSEPPSLAPQHREKMFEVMFETYGFGKMQTAVQGVLSLYSASLQTGIVVDSGEGVTHCMPVFDSYGIPKAVRRVDLGGRDITEFLVRLMQRRGYSFNKSADLELVRTIKEMFCYAAVDFGLEKRLSTETTVLEKAMTLPDGSSCVIGQERFEATEALFNPGLIGYECDGLSTQLWNSINACDMDVRGKLYEHVVLSGGSTMFPGLPTRIERDITAMYLEKALKGDASRLGRFKLKIEDPPRRKHMVFLGGTLLADLTETTEEMWLTKADYQEGGASAIRKRFT